MCQSCLQMWFRFEWRSSNRLGSSVDWTGHLNCHVRCGTGTWSRRRSGARRHWLWNALSCWGIRRSDQVTEDWARTKRTNLRSLVAFSISALQWLCQADKSFHHPVKRLYKFFSTLYSCLVRESPRIECKLQRSSFRAVVLELYFNSTRKHPIKWILSWIRLISSSFFFR